MTKNKLTAFLFCNLAITIFEAIGLVISFAQIGLEAFKYYTELSNLLLFIASVVNIFFATRAIVAKKTTLPKPVWLLFYSAISTTTLTFLVVVFVLSWMHNGLLFVLTTGSMLYTHTICPILGILCFILFAPKIFTKKYALLATSLTGLYGLVAIILNILHIWRGPYPFLYVHEQPVWASIAWLIGILGGAYGITRLLLVSKIVKNKHAKL